LKKRSKKLLLPRSGRRRAPISKSFLVLFFKKELLSSFTRLPWRHLLPVLQTWLDQSKPVAGFPRWWAGLIYGALISIVGAVFSSNTPLNPREVIKSVGIGFALDAANILKRAGIG
jgi:hypothetical protein